MAAASPTTPATTALEIVAPVSYNLDKFPVDRFNRLIPTQTIAMPSDLFRPIVQVVELEERDSYTSPDVPNGNKALARSALRKFATAAGISIIDERRTDDGSNPDVCEVTCLAEMTLPTGGRIRAPGMKRVDLSRLRWASDAQRAKYASFFQEHVASRAENRAIRALLSLQASYPIAELRRPFAVVSFAPNMDHPDVRARVLDAVAPAVAGLFGPASAGVAQLGPGDLKVVEPAPADDGDPGPTDGATGETSTPAAAEPDWFAPKGEDGAPPNWLPETLRRRAAASKMQGAATEPQRAQLRTVLGPLGLDVVKAGLQRLFELDDLREITAQQAQAVIAVAADADPDTFLSLWREMVTTEEAA